MKKIFSFLAALLMAATMFAGRTFSTGDKLYMDCNAVSWWCNDGVSQTMYFVDAANASTSVVGTEYGEAGSKIYEFACPVGTFDYIYEQRGTWNMTGHITLTGTEGKDFIKTFSENSTTVTWGNIGDAPAEDETHYLYVTDGSAHWDNLYVYAWGGKEFFGVWPGTNVRTATQENGKYKLAMTGQPGAEVNLIFHNNAGSQYDAAKFNFSADYNVTSLDPDAPAVLGDVALWPTTAVLPTAIPAEVKVLSLNNSLIHYESEWQDDIFNQMAAAMGKNAVWTAHTNLGKTLQYHWEEGEGMTEAGTPSARKLMRDNAYTHIILQEQTTKPLTNFAGFRESVTTWVNYIRTQSANPNAVIILPVNWALVGNGDTHLNNAKLKQAYLDMAQELGLVLSPVGVAYELAYTADASVMTQGNRWFKDDRHPTQMTTYLGAVLEYSMIYGVNPTTITWKPTTVTDAEATQMRTLAQQALAATAQPVDIYAHSIRFEVRQLDADGNSLATLGATYSGAQLTDSIFTCATAGEYNVAAVCGAENLSSTVTVADMVTVVVELPAISVSESAKTVSQDFNTLPAADGTADAKGALYPENNTLPTGWRIERNQVGPRTIGAFADATETLQYAGGVNLPTNAYNGTWNLGANGSTDRAVGGMTTSVNNGARTINVMAHLTNDGTTDFEKINISYDIEKYRDGSNVNLFYVKLFTSTNGVAWTEAGETFTYLNPQGSGQIGFATVPGATTHVEGTLNYNFKAGTDLFLCWSISTSTGTDCAAAPCLAIDNVNLEFVEPDLPYYPHYIYVDDQTGWATLGLYAYGDATIYGAWPGAAKIGEVDIEGKTYKVFPYDVTTAGTYSLIFNNWNQGLQTPSPDFVINEARDYVLIVTATSITESNVTPPTHDDPQEEEPDYAGIEFSESAATYTQDFNTLPYPASDATAISGLNGVYGMGSELPLGWRAARVETSPRTIGSYANAVDTLQYQGGVSLPANAKNGTWNLGANGSTDRAIGGMTTDAAGGARTINIMAYIKNVDAKAIDSIRLSYNIEKYRDGSNANEFYVKLFTSVDGKVWTPVDNSDFDFINPKGSAQTGFAEVPAASTPISGTLNERIEAGKWLHLCWQIATSTGTVCQAAPCLAIDDVEMTATFATATSLEQNAIVTPSQKRLVNGQIVIIRDGIRYTLLGAKL